METERKLVGIVIKKDGTVPFDPDCPEHLRAQMITHLVEQGHSLDVVHGTRNVKIKNWKPTQ